MSSRTNENYILSEQEINEVRVAFDKYKNDEPRENIWTECHSHFCNLKAQEKASLQQDEIKLSCLLLANYLAVWGMQRNSFLLKTNYHIFENVVNEIFKDDYDLLWDTNYDNLIHNKENYIQKLRD